MREEFLNKYTEYTHLLLPGFSSEVAFLDFLVGAGIPSTVSVIASVFRSLTAATLYVLVWTLTKRKMPSMIAMVVYGLVIVEPTFGWFTWGGMAELIEGRHPIIPDMRRGVHVVNDAASAAGEGGIRLKREVRL